LSASIRLALPGYRRGDRALITSSELAPNAVGNGEARSSLGVLSAGSYLVDSVAMENTAEAPLAQARSVLAARSLALGPGNRTPQGDTYGTSAYSSIDQEATADSNAGTTSESSATTAASSQSATVASSSESLWISSLRSSSMLRSASLFTFARTGEDETSALVSIPSLLRWARHRGRYVPTANLPMWKSLWTLPSGVSPTSRDGERAAKDAFEAADAASKLASAIAVPFTLKGGVASEGPAPYYAIPSSADSSSSVTADAAAEAARQNAYWADIIAAAAIEGQGTERESAKVSQVPTQTWDS